MSDKERMRAEEIGRTMFAAAVAGTVDPPENPGDAGMPPVNRRVNALGDLLSRIGGPFGAAVFAAFDECCETM